MGWIWSRARTVAGVVMVALGVAILAQAITHQPGAFGSGGHWTWDAFGLGVATALLLAGALALFRRA